MYKVLYNKKLNSNSYEMCLEAPMVIKNFIPGQFCIVMSYIDSERIPLTIYDVDRENNLLYLIYQVVGASTEELSKVNKELYSVTGPLGNPSEICINYNLYKKSKILYVAGGVGIAPIYPQIKYLNEIRINTSVIYGARSKDDLVVLDEMKEMCDIHMCTDDGSFGIKGNVVDLIKQENIQVDYYYACGPYRMLEAVAKAFNEGEVSLEARMGCGFGACMGCSIKTTSGPKRVCKEGPVFKGKEVLW